jgi:hypothetical protein
VTWLPQFGQYCVLTGAPQLAQNLSPGWTVEPHFEQFISHLTIIGKSSIHDRPGCFPKCYKS